MTLRLLRAPSQERGPGDADELDFRRWDVGKPDACRVRSGRDALQAHRGLPYIVLALEISFTLCLLYIPIV